jgi:hypothetical protein
MKKFYFAALIGLTALTVLPTAAQAKADVPGCEKTYWNTKWFGLSWLMGHCARDARIS